MAEVLNTVPFLHSDCCIPVGFCRDQQWCAGTTLPIFDIIVQISLLITILGSVVLIVMSCFQMLLSLRGSLVGTGTHCQVHRQATFLPRLLGRMMWISY